MSLNMAYINCAQFVQYIYNYLPILQLALDNLD